MRRKFICGNWKMNKTAKEAAAFADEFLKLLKPCDLRLAFAAPFTALPALSERLAGSGVEPAAQNMHFEDSGAFTGEVSAAMLKDIGVNCCIIGHSERRQYFAETDESVNLKLRKALACGISPIVCVGESLEQREAGSQSILVEGQVRAAFEGISAAEAELVTVAYEPIWAIGTGVTASAAQAQEMCAFIRRILADIYGADSASRVIIQYGGSVKPSNAAELLNQPDIDGALVGGASLKSADFWGIIEPLFFPAQES
ncbi:MAG TPA: triose-phosphate isomerase [Bacillota bacterium]|nr:triose-phosphate isomerase [Bacillota bacterium]